MRQSSLDGYTIRNGHNSKQKPGEGANAKVGIRGRLSHFTWSWFECIMSTGAIGTLLSQQHNSFHGRETIGKVFFILDLVLFLLFSALIVTRHVLNPWAFTKSLHHPHERQAQSLPTVEIPANVPLSFYFGTFWVSLALILYCIQQYAVPSCGPLADQDSRSPLLALHRLCDARLYFPIPRHLRRRAPSPSPT